MSFVSKRISRFGLTARFVSWFLLISLVPLGVIGYLSYVSAKSAINDQVRERVASIAYSRLQHVLSIRNQALSATETFADEDATVNLLADIEKGESKTAQKNINILLHNYVQHTGQFYRARVVDTNGIVIADSLSGTKYDETGTDLRNTSDFSNYFKAGLADLFISSARINKSTEVQELLFVAPIDGDVSIGASDSKVIGSLILSQAFDGAINAKGLNVDPKTGVTVLASYNQVLTEPSGLGETGQSYLFDEADLSQLTPDKGVPFEETFLVHKVEEDLGVHCKNSNSDLITIELSEGGQAVAGTEKIADTDWCIGVEFETAEVFAPAVAMRNQILLFGALIMLIVFGLAWYASHSIGEFVRKPIRSAVMQIRAAAGNLSSSTQQASAAAQQNSSISQQVAAGATQQSKQSEEVSKSVSQMASAIKQMSASAQEAALSASQSAKVAQIAGVNSEKIGEIVQSITAIAEQTNLLALNAAIEAARAGEAGRGFAVVADEVRKLAEGSAKSAGEIREVVKSVQSSMGETVKSIDEVSAKIQEVSAGIREQATAVQQVAGTMDQIASVAEENASGAQQLAASTQQQSASNQQVAAASQQLNALSEELGSLAGQMRELDHVVQKIRVERVLADNTVPPMRYIPAPENRLPAVPAARAKKIIDA